MTWLATILKALAEALLDFAGQRLERRDADAAQREVGARQTQEAQHERAMAHARQAASMRARPADADAELDDRLRAPADRGQNRGD